MRSSSKLLIGTASVLAAIVLWYLVCATRAVSPDLLASPGQVLAAFIDIAQHGYRETTLSENIVATLWRCLAGFSLAVVTGVPLGLWMGTSPITAGAVNYIIQFLRPLPPLSYLVLLILWFGAGDLSKVALLFMGAFPTITSAAMAGVRQVNSRRIEVAQALGASKRQIFAHVVFPSALSMIFTGLRIALAGAFSSVVAAELMTATNGLGWMVFSASRFQRNDVILLGIILLGLFGMALSRILLSIDLKIVHWRGRE